MPLQSATTKYKKTSYANHQSLRIGFYFLVQNVCTM